jgi:ABC-type uncharacterized transport system auxiliary subunit
MIRAVLLVTLALATLLSGCWHDSAETRDRYQAAYQDTQDAKSGAKD